MSRNYPMNRELKVLLSMAGILLFLTFFLPAYINFFPVYRSGQMEFLKENYTYLKDPEVNLKSLFRERNRKIAFVNEQRKPSTPDEKGQAAVIYMAEVEAKVGKQEWLDRAYQTYLLTSDELERLRVMDQVYEDKERLKVVQDDRELKSSDAATKHRQYADSEDVLKERSVWLAAN